MARLAIVNHAKLSWLLVRGGLRRLAGRVNGHPLLRWPVFSFRTDRLLLAPPDLRTADATRASEIYSGRFAFAGKVVICDGRSIFEMEPPSEEWATELLGFGWLRHLRAAESAITRANARALVDEWIALQGSWHNLAWRPDVLSRRVISWLSQATLVLQDADVLFYRRFLRSLIRQVRYLRHTAGDARRGVGHLQAIIALADATLCIAGQAGRIKPATERLRAELQRQILPDGGHISRDPGAIIEILLELLPLRQAYASRNLAPPPALLNAIDRMMPMLRFFCHSDGSFARFNGMGATPVDLLLTLLAYDETRGAPLSSAPHSGYQRLEAGGGVLIMDAGRAPPVEMSLEAHAGCLAFEYSTPKQNLLIVNCGMPPTGREDWRQLARSTLAHSTVTFNDASSASFVTSPTFRRVLGGAPMLGGPSHVAVAREDHPDAIVLRATHDGYAERFGILHERTLTLAADGTRLEGEDAFLSVDGSPQVHTTRDKYAVRFHLHPTVKATRLSDGHGVMLMTPDKEVWTFTVRDGRTELEDSVYLAGAEGPRRTVQIVIYGHARHAPRVSWNLQHSGSPAMARATARATRADEPKLPL
ncbi:MAG TPA: heparinase II/III family protein [Xanthobacteraceae bacterium]|nr:heparinase II/III family protein [Xanthobacteraceae bacterium]